MVRRTFSINEKNQITGISDGSTNDSYSYSGLDQTDRVQYNGASAIYSSLGLSVDGVGSASATYYTRTNQGQLVNERTTSGTYYYLMDDLGSVLKVVDSSGNVKNSYYYDPYGMSLNKNETVSNPWQYASGYFDANTGLYKFGTRYYDPQTGRWTQKDPVGGSVGKIGSGNPYVYADNEPDLKIDPSGAVTVACILGEIGVIVSGLSGFAAFIGSELVATGAEGTLAALTAEGASDAQIAAATTTALGSSILVYAAAGVILGVLITVITVALVVCGRG